MPFPDALSNVVDAPDGTETLGGSTPSHTVHTQALVDATNETQAALLHRARADERVFDAVAYGAAVDGSTDDTAAWQAALDACAAAGGGVVTSSKPGVSVIDGALQDTSGANAQLLLPAIDAVDSESVSITIRGPWQPPTVFSVIGATPVPDNHLVLKSTLATGTGAVIGAQGPAGTFNNFTNVHLRVENLTVRTVSNPTISGLDLRHVASVDLDAVVVDCGSYYVQGLTEPTTATSYGVRLPKNGNGAHVRLGMVDVCGFYTGFEFAEHAKCEYVAAWGCKVAAEFDATDHASVFTRFMAVHCPTGFKFVGAHAVDVWQFNIEHAASGWWVTTYDVDDASAYGSGFVRWWAVLAGVGAHDSFTVNGGAGLSWSRVGEALGAGGGGTSYYWRQDNLTAAAGNDTLTLGATPQDGSLLVFVDGVPMSEGDGWVRTGALVEFDVALSAGVVVQTMYATTTASPGAGELSTGGAVSIADDFNRANSTSSLGSTSTGAAPWTAHAGTWGIDSNRAYVSAGSTTNLATIDGTAANGTISVKLAAGGAVTGGIVFRHASTGNCYVFEVTAGGTGVTVYKGVGGSYSTLATGTTGAAVTAGDTISVELSGTAIVCKHNGSTVISTTDATYQTATNHGMYIVGGASALRLDDFSFTG